MGVIRESDLKNNGARLVLAMLCIAGVAACKSGEALLPLDLLSVAPIVKRISVSILDYCPQSGYAYSDFWVSNRSVRVERGKVYLDWDRDGLPNVRDADLNLGLTPTSADSNSDGYGDLLMAWGGFTVDAQRSLKPCLSVGQDTDLDGLTDCEEDNLTHTDPKKFDTDGDGVPDSIEISSSLNPKDPTDAAQDSGQDGLTNLERIKLGLPVNETLSEEIRTLSYRYDVQVRADLCLDLTVSGIPIVEVSNGNLIQFTFFETGPGETRTMHTRSTVVPRSTTDGASFVFEYSDLNQNLARISHKNPAAKPDTLRRALRFGRPRDSARSTSRSGDASRARPCGRPTGLGLGLLATDSCEKCGLGGSV